MISFKSRNQAIKNADKITRLAHSVYPHISESRIRTSVGHQLLVSKSEKNGYKLSNMVLKNSTKIDTLRYKSGEGIDLFRNILDMLKTHKIGNCYENAVLAEIIGKINGIKNIYPVKIYFNRNSSGAKTQLDHVVTIITDINLNKNVKYDLTNKSAIVLDPWLGITEYVSEYVNKLRNDFEKIFSKIPDDSISIRKILLTAKNPKEFHEAKKKVFKPDFSFMLHDDELLSQKDAEILKQEYPELGF